MIWQFSQHSLADYVQSAAPCIAFDEHGRSLALSHPLSGSNSTASHDGSLPICCSSAASEVVGSSGAPR